MAKTKMMMMMMMRLTILEKYLTPHPHTRIIHHNVIHFGFPVILKSSNVYVTCLHYTKNVTSLFFSRRLRHRRRCCFHQISGYISMIQKEKSY